MSLTKKLNDLITGGIQKIKSDYGYYKAAKKQEYDDQYKKSDAALREKNIKRLTGK